MAETAPLTTEQRAQLVAYLDGELDSETTQRLEEALVKNPVLRREAEILTRTWDMLDLLPRAEVGEEFTERTVATATLRDEELPGGWSQRARRGTVLAGWTLAMVVSAVVGFLWTNRWIPDPQAEVVQDFAVVKDLDRYLEIGDVEFLRLLNDHQVFEPDGTAEKKPR